MKLLYKIFIVPLVLLLCFGADSAWGQVCNPAYPMTMTVAPASPQCQPAAPVVLTVNGYNPSCTQYTERTIPLAMRPAPVNIIPSTFCNNSFGPLPIGFTFSYFCQNYTQFNGSVNGFITMGAAATGAFCGQNNAIPNAAQPNNYIAAAWGVLDISGSSCFSTRLSYETQGTAPNRVLVVEWDRIDWYLGGNPCTARMQIQLYETSNKIEIHVSNLGTNRGFWAGTQGVEDATGANGLAVAGRNGTFWSANDAHCFQPQGNASLVIRNTTNGFIATGVTSATDPNPPVGNSTYDLLAIDPCANCTTTVSIPYTVNPTPTITINPANATKCSADPPIQLTASGAVTYTWLPVAGLSNPAIANPTANPAATTTYTVTGRNAQGCTGTARVTVTVNATPTITINPASVAKCFSQPAVQLTASGANTYSWSPATGLSATNIANPTANPPTTTTYTVTGTAANGCTNSTTIVVTVNLDPVVTIAPAAVTKCLNDAPVQLTASGAAAYVWSPATGLDNANIATPLANPATTTTYTVTGTAGGGCTGSATVTVTVNPNPTVTVNPASATKCFLDPPVQLTAAGATTYSWSPATGLSATNIANPTANPPVTTTYTVTGTNAFNCTGTAITTITVVPNPATPTTLVNTNPVCPDQRGTVYSVINNPAVSYTWTVPGAATLVSGQGTNQILVDWTAGGVPTVAGSYTISVTATASGCTSPAQNIVVTVQNPPPAQPSIPNGPTPVCVNTSGTYSVTNDPTATSYIWGNIPGGAFISNGLGTNQVTINWGTAPVGTYQISVIAANSCGQSPPNFILVDVITVRPQPSIITPPTPICLNQTATFTVTNDPLATSYTWTNSCGWTGTSTTNSIDYIPTTVGPCIISVVANNQCGASTARSLTVTARDVPALPLPINGQTTVCQNTILTYSVPAVNGVTYTWGVLPTGASYVSGQGTNSVRINWGTAVPGTYTIDLTPSNVCGNGPIQTIDVTVIAIPVQPTVNGNTNVCVGNSQVYDILNVQAGVSYSWTVTPSGPSLSPSGSTVTVVWTQPGTYTLTATPSNACGVGTPGGLTVTVTNTVTATIAPQVQTSCNPTYQITGVNPAGGTYTCVLCPGGATVDPNTGLVSGMSIPMQGYVINYTVNNPPCASSSVQVSVQYQGIVAGTVGTPQTVCQGASGSVILTGYNGNIVRWERSADCITFSAIQNTQPINTYINLTQTTCFRAVVGRGNCTSLNTNSVVITVVPNVTATATPASQTVCGATGTVTGNLPPNTTGNWTFISGPTIATITTNVGTGSITGMTATGTYVFRWTLSNPPCQSSSVDVTVTRTPPLSIPDAGNDQTICSNRATLVGNVPVVGTGSWVFISGPVTPSMSNVGQNMAIANGLTIPGFYVFEYRISGVGCPPLTDQVTIERLTPTTQANAGLDQIICDNFVTLQGNTPPITGIGTWSFVTGPAQPAIAQFGHIANITGLTVAGNYFFRYTITNGQCPPTTDDVMVTVLPQPSQAQVPVTTYNICGLTALTIRATRPLNGVGTWSIVSVPPGANPTINTSGTDGFIIGMTLPGAYVFRWTVSNPPCTQSSFIDVTVNREDQLTGNINPGPNQVLCNTTTTTLTALTPIPPRSGGVWNYVSGPVPNVNVTTTGLVGMVTNMTQPGTYVFEWKVSRLTGSCPSQSAAVTVEIKPLPTTADAGNDQTICGSGPVSLIGNIPQVGTGAWSFLSGPMTPSISSNSNLASISNMTMSGTYCFRWTISNAPCTPSTDDVCINVSIPAIAGTVTANQTVCAGTNSGTLTLSGQSGTIVRWQSSTDNFATFTDIANPTPTQNFTNLMVTTQYRAVIGSGTCPQLMSAPATITVAQPPMAANAGNDQTFCGRINSATLVGNTPNNLMGTWSYVGTPSQPFFTVSGNILTVFNVGTPGVYTFRWTLANPPCTPMFDDVDVIVIPQSNGGTLTANATVCSGNNTGTLAVTGQVGNVLRWESSTDGGNSWSAIVNTNPTLTYTNLTVNTVYRVVVQNGICPMANSNNVTITVSTPPTVANAGPDQNFCGNVTSTTLAGNMPLVGTGTWSLVSQPNGAVASVVTNAPFGQVTGMTIDGTYVFRWSIANAPCPPSTDDVSVTRITATIPGSLSQNALVCSGNNSGTLTLTGNNGTIIRWESSTDNWNTITSLAITANTLPYTNLTQTTAYRVLVVAGVCSQAFSNVVTITVQPPTVPANPGPSAVTVCSGNTMLTALQPPSGQGTWSYVTGPVPFVTLVQAGTMANISGMTLVGNYTFRWTVNNSPCPSASADVVVARLPDGIVANGGNDVTQCGSTLTLTGNDPSPNTSTWMFVSGPATPNVLQAGVNATITGMTTPGLYIFRYTINQPPCPPSMDDVLVNILPGPSPASVITNNVTLCDVNSTTLLATQPLQGTGTWTFIGGPAPASVTSNGTVGNVNNLSVNGTYVFRWTVTNPPCAQTSFVDVTVNRQSGVQVQAFAGSNQSVCNTQFALVSGNTPPFGTTGTWSFANGPAPASIATFGTFGSITGMTLPGPYQFVWTISANNGCPSSSSVVTITRVDPATPATAGPIQTVCGTTAIITGNVPISGTGTWTLVSGPQPTPNLSVQNTTLTVSNMLTPGIYVFRWTISNPPCTASSFDVPITVNQGSQGGILTGGTTACGGNNSGTLTVSQIRGNVVRWESSINDFNTFSIINNISTSQPYNNLTQTTCYRAVVQDGGCPEATSNIQCIRVTPATTVADAGADQTICANNTILTGNIPMSGTGTWSFVTGPAVPTFTQANNTLVVSNMSVQGAYVFRWRIDNTPCGISDDLIFVNVSSPSNAGTASAPATVCAGTNSGNVILTGFSGTILRWESSTDNVVFNPIGNTTPTQTYSNLAQTTWFRAVVQNGGLCPQVTSNAVQITVRQQEVADAGTNQVICGSNTATLQGNVPVTGTPMWQFISGPVSPSVTQNGASATVTNMNVGGLYTFRYTINNAPCAVSQATVTVQISPTPIAGNVSLPMTVCDANNSATLVLSGFTGSIVRWESSEDNFTVSTVIHVNPTAQHTFFNLTRTTWYRAVVSGAGCQEVSSAPAKITVIPGTTIADAGLDQTICGTTIVLNGNAPVSGTSQWTFMSGPLGNNVNITQSGNDISVVGMTVPGNYVFRYRINNPPCTMSEDMVQVTVLAPTQAGTVSSPATVCTGTNNGTLTLAGNNAPIVRWEFSFDNGTSWNPIGNFTNVQTYQNLNQNTIFRAVVQAANCPVTFSNQVLITVVDPASGGTVSGNSTVCRGNNGGQLTLSGQIGSVVRWEQSVDGINWTNLLNNTNTQFYSNLTVTTSFRAIISNPCGNVASSAGTITVDQPSVAGNISGAATVCSGNNSGSLTLGGQVGSIVSWETSTDGINFTANGNTTPNQSYTNLTQSTIFRVVVRNGACASVVSAGVSVTVSNNSNAGNLSAPATVCAGNNNGTLNLTGNVGSILRWEFSVDNGVNWNTIVNTNNTQTYSNLGTNTRYRVVVQNANCGVAFSNEVQITMLPNNDGGVTSGNATVCAGNNFGQITLSNFVGTIVRWESSVDGINFLPINNNTPVQGYGNLIQTTFYRAVVTSQQCGGQTFSTMATVTVTQNSVGGTITGQQNVCGNFASGVLVLNGQIGNVLRWESSTDGFNFTSINTNSPTLSYNVNQTTFFRAVVQSGNCAQALSNTVTVSVQPPSVAGNLSGGGTVCSGNNSGTLVLSGHQGTIVRWESSVNGGQTWSTINNNTPNLTFSNLTQATQYRVVVKNGNCPGVISNEIGVVIGSNIQLTANPMIGCTGGGSIQANATGGVGPYTYSINPQFNDPNNTGLFTGLPTGNYTIIATDAAGCSRSITVNLGNTPTAPVIGNILNITTNSAIVSWPAVPPGVGIIYTFRYRILGSPTWTTITNITGTSINLGGLQNNTTYEVALAYQCCSNCPLSAFSSGNNFTTNSLGDCSIDPVAVPGGFFVNNVSQSTALTNWNRVNGAMGYIISWGLITQNPVNWQQVIVCDPVTSFLITGLTPNTNYGVKIRTNCTNCTTALNSNDRRSPWSITLSYQTLASKEGGVVAQTSNQVSALEVYPNPNKGQFTVKYESNSAEPVRMVLIDALGREVYRHQTTTTEGFNEWNVEPQGLASGVYMLRTMIGETERVVKVVVE